METARLEDRTPFITADGSSIRELAGVPTGNASNQSLAEATVPPGGTTIEHYHRTSEEIYLFTQGMGRMRLGVQEGPVRAGDAVLIAPGTPHKLLNPGPEPLVLLCCCAPPYRDEDTDLLEPRPGQISPPRAGGFAPAGPAGERRGHEGHGRRGSGVHAAELPA